MQWLASSTINNLRNGNSEVFKRILSDVDSQEVIILTGNFTVDGRPVNILQYDATSGDWSAKYQSSLYFYGESYINGVIWDVATYHNTSSEDSSDTLYVVGNFDTESETSQLQLCSVSKWNGLIFEKVGEGICPRGADPSSPITILTSLMGNNGNLFIGGMFESRVWDGHHFVYVYNIARFDSIKKSWLPLVGGQLSCKNGQRSKVQALAWDAHNAILFIGGSFDMLGDDEISSGLAIWTENLGIVSFPRGGVTIDEYNNGAINSLAFEPISESLFAAGYFLKIGNYECMNIAVWSRANSSWKCLYQDSYAITTLTTMFLDTHKLFISGWAASNSNWEGRNWNSPYAIARLDIAQYILECSSSENIAAYQAAHSSKYSHKRRSRAMANSSSTYSGKYTSRRFSGNTTSPTSAPTPMPPWTPQWEWLPNFSGANGPILRIVKGKNAYANNLFIVGAFNNYPSVSIWSENSDDKLGGISGLTTSRAIHGLITSIVQVRLPYQDVPAPAPSPVPDSNGDTILILFSCVMVGIMLGAAFAFGYSTMEYSKVNDSDGDDNGMMIPLKTLSGGVVNNREFKKCFEKAMKARHLPTHESLLIINPKEISLSKIIGEGSFGRVWSGQWRNNAVAVKEFVFAQAAIVGESIDRMNLVEEIVGEAGIMACLRHQKILQLYGCSLTMQAIWIVSQLCQRGSLRMVLNDQSLNLTTSMKLSLVMDVADGMLYLHSRVPPIIHRDLKSHNVFITEEASGHFTAKIGDWGSARAVALTGPKSMTQGVGTACWLAPEVIKNAHSSKSSDVYAFGILMWEVYTRSEVHEGLSAAQIIAKVAHEGLRPKIPKNCPWKEIMSECWHHEPSMRPGFPRIMEALKKIAKPQVEADSSTDLSQLPISSLHSQYHSTMDSDSGDRTQRRLPSGSIDDSSRDNSANVSKKGYSIPDGDYDTT